MNMDDNNYTIEIIDDKNYDIVIDKDGFIGATSWGSITGDINNQQDLKTELDKKEDKSNKSGVLSSSSTDEQYPTSKVVYDTVDNLKQTVDSDINNLTETVNNEIGNLEEAVNNKIVALTDTVNADINNLAEFKEYSNNTFETKTSHSNDMNTKADKFTTDSPLQYTNNNIKLNVDNQLLKVNSSNELTVNVDEINSELTDKLNTDVSNITDTGKQTIINTIPKATVQDVGLVKPDNDTITIDEDGTIHSVGGGSSEANDYGIKGDYSTHYGILDCPNGLIDIVSGKTIKINSGIILQCAGQESKTTIASSFTQELTSTGDIVLFYAGGSFIECGDVFYQEAEPEDGTSNYVAWYKPSNNTWSFKSNDTGNVFRTAIATPIANIRLTSTDITRIDYIGYRILDDEIFALKTDLPTKTSQLTNDSGYLTSLPSGAVTVNTAQTITGVKKFTRNIQFTSLSSTSISGYVSISNNDGMSVLEGTGLYCESENKASSITTESSEDGNLKLKADGKIIIEPKEEFCIRKTADEEYQILDEDNFKTLKGKTIDGVWVVDFLKLCTLVKTKGSYQYDISEYLPDSNYTYEIRVNLYVSDDHTSSEKNVWSAVGTSKNPFSQEPVTTNGIVKVVTDTYADKADNTGTLVFTPDNRTMHLEITERNLTNGVNIELYGYRRLGTNE